MPILLGVIMSGIRPIAQARAGLSMPAQYVRLVCVKDQKQLIHEASTDQMANGLAKCFAEDMAKLYWDKKGLEAVCLRILSCADVGNARAVGSWLS